MSVPVYRSPLRMTRALTRPATTIPLSHYLPSTLHHGPGHTVHCYTRGRAVFTDPTRLRPFPLLKHCRNSCRNPSTTAHRRRASSPTSPSPSTSPRDHAQPTMNSSPNNDLLAGLIPQTQSSAPITPQPSHASIPQGTTDAVSKVQAERVGDATVSISLTPPPSAQVNNNPRPKSHTPTPTFKSSDSHISTPPSTIHVLNQDRPTSSFAHTMTVEEIASAPADDLRLKVGELQAAYREAKMSAAHHRLQYQMLAQ